MLITIPPNYAEEGSVPICIRDTDTAGHAVFPGWIEAVVPIANQLRSLVQRVTGDIWHVSEVTEDSVHRLSRKHGANLGPHPSRAIYVHAHYKARDLAAGSRRLRVGLDVELKEHVLACLSDPHDFALAYETKDLIQKLEARLDDLGLSDVQLMLNLYLADAEDQIPILFRSANRRERNKLSQRFRRGLQRALTLL